MELNNQKKQLQLLQFVVLDANVCIDIDNINKVLPLLMLEPVPGGPPYLAGIMNFAGKSIPVIDLALRLGMIRNKVYSLDMSIILCSRRAHQIGLIVDKVQGLFLVNADDLQMSDEFTDVSSYIATVTLGSTISLMINVDCVLQFDISETGHLHE